MKTKNVICKFPLLASLFLFCMLAVNGWSQEQEATLSNGTKVILHEDKTWDYKQDLKYNFDFSTLKNKQIPDFLRSGIAVNQDILTTAVEMHLQGWSYTMPQPKSTQANWGNSDGRTTWWNGYWYNSKTGFYSEGTPAKRENGYYYGDKQDVRGWCNGGCPPYPDKLEWLLSKSGGVKPS